MIKIERDQTLRMFELTDYEGEKHTKIRELDLAHPLQLSGYDLVGIYADDMGVRVNRFYISDKLLRELCDRRGWIK